MRSPILIPILCLALVGCRPHPQPTPKPPAAPGLYLSLSGPINLSQDSPAPWTYNVEFWNNTSSTLYLTFRGSESGLEDMSKTAPWTNASDLLYFDKERSLEQEDFIRIGPNGRASTSYELLKGRAPKPGSYQLRAYALVLSPDAWKHITPQIDHNPEQTGKTIFSPALHINVR